MKLRQDSNKNKVVAARQFAMDTSLKAPALKLT